MCLYESHGLCSFGCTFVLLETVEGFFFGGGWGIVRTSPRSVKTVKSPPLPCTDGMHLLRELFYGDPLSLAGLLINPFTTGNPFLGTKLLGFSMGRGSGALKGLSKKRGGGNKKRHPPLHNSYRPKSTLLAGLARYAEPPNRTQSYRGRARLKGGHAVPAFGV